MVFSPRELYIKYAKYHPDSIFIISQSIYIGISFCGLLIDMIASINGFNLFYIFVITCLFCVLFVHAFTSKNKTYSDISVKKTLGVYIIILLLKNILGWYVLFMGNNDNVENSSALKYVSVVEPLETLITINFVINVLSKNDDIYNEFDMSYQPSTFNTNNNITTYNIIVHMCAFFGFIMSIINIIALLSVEGKFVHDKNFFNGKMELLVFTILIAMLTYILLNYLFPHNMLLHNITYYLIGALAVPFLFFSIICSFKNLIENNFGTNCKKFNDHIFACNLSYYYEWIITCLLFVGILSLVSYICICRKLCNKQVSADIVLTTPQPNMYIYSSTV